MSVSYLVKFQAKAERYGLKGTVKGSIVVNEKENKTGANSVNIYETVTQYYLGTLGFSKFELLTEKSEITSVTVLESLPLKVLPVN